MPELPEVETFARTLRPGLTGRQILSAQLLWAKTLATPTPGEFARHITGQTIRDVSRRAKYLDLQLDDFHLFIHLRMSGDLALQPADYQPQKHDRLLLRLSDQRRSDYSTLTFNDPRKFGRIWLTDDPSSVTGRLGPEPLSDAFTPAWLYAALRSRQRQMKPLLLDQGFLAGLGNIYTDEALHLAGIHPLRISDTITKEEANRLHAAIRRALEDGIEHNGASIDWVYRGGGFQNYFRVYGRQGQACPVCGTAIERTVVGQRGTHYCPACQPES
jgi:formamidopyrimidine-DNA glycosylase